MIVKQARVLPKNVRAIEGVKPNSRQVNYRINGERGPTRLATAT